ncbi:MAG: peptide chain release factor N(5)-glutamine methyltransferase [Vicinamibacterales bacterium]
MPASHSLHARIAAGRQALVDAGFKPEDAALDADVLARHVLGWDLARLLAHDREPATPAFSERFQAVIGRRVRREPVAFITGHREFWGLDFEVTPATLVPRPETEMIVDEALRLFPESASPTVLDVGTGTGCLAVAIAVERPRARMTATDISHAALLVARRNAHAHGVAGRVRFVRTDLARGLRVPADLIVSNPPYVPDQTASSLPADVASYEPATALFGGSDGLAVIRRLFAGARHHLAPGGTFIVEFGFGQEDSVRQLASDHGWHVAGLLHDLQGIPRTIVLRR